MLHLLSHGHCNPVYNLNIGTHMHINPVSIQIKTGLLILLLNRMSILWLKQLCRSRQVEQLWRMAEQAIMKPDLTWRCRTKMTLPCVQMKLASIPVNLYSNRLQRLIVVYVWKNNIKHYHLTFTFQKWSVKQSCIWSLQERTNHWWKPYHFTIALGTEASINKPCTPHAWKTIVDSLSHHLQFGNPIKVLSSKPVAWSEHESQTWLLNKIHLELACSIRESISNLVTQCKDLFKSVTQICIEARQPGQQVCSYGNTECRISEWTTAQSCQEAITWPHVCPTLARLSWTIRYQFVHHGHSRCGGST